MKALPLKSLLPGLLLVAFAGHASAGVLDPECTPEKAAKSAAAKATVGVGGRCDAKEAAKDSMGLDDKKDALAGDKDDRDGVLSRDQDDADDHDKDVLQDTTRKAAGKVIKP
ncbi:hypothetical protein [Pseudoxanthomonas dokdonensis]|uniref:Uncharacterized protein n=1 Tax=Pseudoxanthomonas dokdonensis TaxID=344882 RepID=A0A0R0CV60_9GAMM|nr:hypothetical protein [Pseudoxanthomonas dokdonensis]KRG69171.1 hypothetical protein ABB29_12300 [Pseudoxanthomonas dokdonensis]